MSKYGLVDYGGEQCQIVKSEIVIDGWYGIYKNRLYIFSETNNYYMDGRMLERRSIETGRKYGIVSHTDVRAVYYEADDGEIIEQNGREYNVIGNYILGQGNKGNVEFTI